MADSILDGTPKESEDSQKTEEIPASPHVNTSVVIVTTMQQCLIVYFNVFSSHIFSPLFEHPLHIKTNMKASPRDISRDLI